MEANITIDCPECGESWDAHESLGYLTELTPGFVDARNSLTATGQCIACAELDTQNRLSVLVNA